MTQGRFDMLLGIQRKLQDAHDSLTKLYGAEFPEKIAPWMSIVSAVMVKHRCVAMEVPIRIDPRPEGYGMVWLLAAVVEMYKVTP